MTPGQKFRKALADNKPLQIVGTINAYAAMMAERIGHQAIYLSGGGVANASYGLPDLGMTSLNDVLEDVRRITSASSLPLLVDIDTGWGGAFNITRTIQQMEKAGAAAVHIEDQVMQKRCGHRPNKEIVSKGEMVDRIKACVDARNDESFFIMARTDAFAQEGLEAAIERAQACVAAGADGIFAEAIKTEEHYRAFADALDVPILANITEFGQTELWNREQLGEWGCGDGPVPTERLPCYEQSRGNRVQEPVGRRRPAQSGRYHADPDGTVRLPELPQLRAETRFAVCRRQKQVRLNA